MSRINIGIPCTKGYRFVMYNLSEQKPQQEHKRSRPDTVAPFRGSSLVITTRRYCLQADFTPGEWPWNQRKNALHSLTIFSLFIMQATSQLIPINTLRRGYGSSSLSTWPGKGRGTSTRPVWVKTCYYVNVRHTHIIDYEIMNIQYPL